MSWAMASFLVLGLALAAGFAWYERSHPSARVLALVGTLAALAALGRIAFAPLPNVKPTTDIVLIAGYVLGGAPGFAVGATAALASNLFYGQGPWTPWQMAAWGLVGVGGAVLARLTGRRLPRVPLALACAVAGLAYGAILNFSTWITFVGNRSLASFGIVYSQALWFDIAHAVGNLVFALVFGPALVRALERYRARFEVTWGPATGAATIAVAALALGAAAASPARAAAASPTAYLLAAQNADGGWGAAPAQGSSGLYTGWTALGLAAAGRNPLDVHRRGRSVVAYLRAHARDVNDAGEVERTILVLVAAGASPRDLGGRDLVAALLRRRRADGSITGQVNLTAFGILALRAAGRAPGDRTVRAAARWLARQEDRDGGFNFFRRGGTSDIDDTGAALQALAAAGRRGTKTARRAVAFLRRVQNPDGGFPQRRGEESNAQSAAWAVQGLVAVRRNPDRLRRGAGRSPLGYLRSLTGPDGAVRYSRTSRQTPVWVTAQALLALRRRALPLARLPRASRPAHTTTRARPAPRAPRRTTTRHATLALGALAAAARAAGAALAALLSPWR